MLSTAFFCALLSATTTAAPVTAGINWVQGTWADALQQAYSTHKPIMALFFRPTCEGCILFADSTLSAPEVIAFADGFVCARVDEDSAAGKELAARFKVTVTPVTVFFDWKGEETDRVVGGPPAPQFLAEMKRIRSGRDTVRDLLARESQHREDVEFNALLGGKLAQRGDARGRPYLERVLMQDSTNAKGKSGDAFLGLYRLARLDGDVPGAIAVLERMLRSIPTSDQAPLARSYLAYCYRKVGQNARADSLEAASPDSSAALAGPAMILPVTVTTARGPHVFRVELAHTAGEQDRGLQARKDIDKDGGMLFAPLPPDGGPPAMASFWMKDTPIALDIIFIRADGTIARIAANAVPLSRTPILSRTPVAAVLEILGGRAAELGMAEGDMVSWQRP